MSYSPNQVFLEQSGYFTQTTLRLIEAGFVEFAPYNSTPVLITEIPLINDTNYGLYYARYVSDFMTMYCKIPVQILFGEKMPWQSQPKYIRQGFSQKVHKILIDNEPRVVYINTKNDLANIFSGLKHQEHPEFATIEAACAHFTHPLTVASTEKPFLVIDPYIRNGGIIKSAYEQGLGVIGCDPYPDNINATNEWLMQNKKT